MSLAQAMLSAQQRALARQQRLMSAQAAKSGPVPGQQQSVPRPTNPVGTALRWYVANSGSTATSTWVTGGTNSTTSTVTSTGDDLVYYAQQAAEQFVAGKVRVTDGNAAEIALPDGSVIRVERDGSYRIDDKDAKVIYRANRIRAFNTFLNASDRMEEFIRFCGEQGVRRDEMLKLPISLFIGWLVLEAAQADGEPEPALPLIADLRKVVSPKCGGCGRFLPRRYAIARINHCRPLCLDRHLIKLSHADGVAPVSPSAASPSDAALS